MCIFDRIWAAIFAFLLMLFPSLNRYSPAMDWKAATNTVLTAIQNHDIDTIEAFMCKNIKDNTPDLHAKIGQFIDAIQGNITKITERASSGSGFYMSAGGKTIDQKDAVWSIETTEGIYTLSIVWEIYNNFSFEERGIRGMGLMVETNNGPVSCGVVINATEGIGYTHN